MGAAVSARVRAFNTHTTLGADGLWWSFPITTVLAGLVAIAIFYKGDWAKRRLVEAEEVLAEKVSEEMFTQEAYTNRHS